MANGTLAASQIEMLTQSGTGIVTIVPPATNTNRTLTLPDSTGTLLNTNGGTITGNLTVSGITTLGNGAILGTPASGTATNLTGLPISTGVSGLGTGIATALAVNVGTAGAPVVNGGALGSPSSVGTIPAFTLGGTVSGGGNQINNVVIGTTSPLAGNFTTVTASGLSTFSTSIRAVGMTDTALTGNANQAGFMLVSSGDYMGLRSNTNHDLIIEAFQKSEALKIANATGLVTMGYGAAVTGALSATGNATFSGGTATINNLVNTVGQAATLTLTTFNTNFGSSYTLQLLTTLNNATTGASTTTFKQFNHNIGSDDVFITKTSGDAGYLAISTGTGAAEVARFTTTGLAVTGALSATGTLSGGTSGTGYSFSGSAPATSLTLDSSGNLGVGTTIITSRLFVADPGTTLPTGNSSGTGFSVGRADGLIGLSIGYLASNQSSYLQSKNFTNTDMLPILLNPSGGNVGIGTSSPSSKLSVVSTIQDVATFAHSSASTDANNGGALIRIQNTSSTNGNMQSLQFNNASGSASSAIFGYNANQSTNEGFLTFGNRNSSGTFGERMRLDSSGNLGIGTTSPATKLDVVGAISVTGTITSGVTADAVLQSTNTSTSRKYIEIGNTSGDVTIGVESSAGGALVVGTAAYSAVVGTPLAKSLHLFTNNTARLTIDSSGNVGIGTSSPITYVGANGQLVVNGGVATTFTNCPVNVTLVNEGGIAAGLGCGIGFTMNYDNVATTLYGTISCIRENATNPNSAGTLTFGVRDASAGVGIERMRINSSGNVGIGTSSPSTKLEVVGAVTATQYSSGLSGTTASLAPAASETILTVGGYSMYLVYGGGTDNTSAMGMAIAQANGSGTVTVTQLSGAATGFTLNASGSNIQITNNTSAQAYRWKAVRLVDLA